MAAGTIKLFLTGDPGSGKTTLLRRVVDQLAPAVPLTGFLTEEILEDGRRSGFRGVTLAGATFLLASRASQSPLRIGPYGVDLEGLETLGLNALRPAAETRLVVLDEVGKMECLSPRFRAEVEALLASDVPLLASVASHGVGFVKRVRQDPRIRLVRLSRASRAGSLGEILRLLAAAGIAAPTDRTTTPRRRPGRTAS